MSQFHLHSVDITPGASVPTYEVSIGLSECKRLGEEVVLTEPCKTGSEIDEVIDRLITQLNAIRHKAKEKIADRLRE